MIRQANWPYGQTLKQVHTMLTIAGMQPSSVIGWKWLTTVTVGSLAIPCYLGKVCNQNPVSLTKSHFGN